MKIVGKRRALQLLATANIMQYEEAIKLGLADALLNRKEVFIFLYNHFSRIKAYLYMHITSLCYFCLYVYAMGDY